MRAAWIDRAIDENDVEITSSAGYDEGLAIVADYCSEHAGFNDITNKEFGEACGRWAERATRKLAGLYGDFTNADPDQDAAMIADLERIQEIAGQSSFNPAGMSIEGILAEMDSRGELSDAEKREAAGIRERLPVIMTVSV